MTAAERWAADLARWAIPQEILDQVDEMPWTHPVKQFTAPDVIPDSPSHSRAREALPAGGSVLDVGSGGGRASLALVPPAGRITAVDTSPGMLEAFVSGAGRRGVEAHTILGEWPRVEDEAPVCDVVVCHHVVYNVPDIAPFLRALTSQATRRVVVELPVRHPLTWLNPLWKHFWDLDRPMDPTADDLVACAREVGLDPTLEVWVDAQWGSRVDLPRAERVAMARTRVCLTPDRDPEVADFLAHMPESPERRVATLWWDVG